MYSTVPSPPRVQAPSDGVTARETRILTPIKKGNIFQACRHSGVMHLGGVFLSKGLACDAPQGRC